MRRAIGLRTWRAAVILLSIGLAGAVRGDEPDRRPNIVFAIADDWSWPHAGAYSAQVNTAPRPEGVAGDQGFARFQRTDGVVKTPAFDRVAAEGVLFTNAFCASPSCTPSRGAILTGQAVHRLENGANLWSILPAKFRTYPDLLEASGYVVGLTGKGWGPGSLEGTGRARNPAGPTVKSFDQFLKRVPKGKPFCYWYGSVDPHRPYEPGTGAKSGMKLDAIAVPPIFPDTPEVRSDIADYYFEVERFDRSVAAILARLEADGLAENTIVVITSDNGMPFPRCKANLYDSGTHMPLAIRWPAKHKGGQVFHGFVGLADIAPTFLEAAGLKPLPEMTGRSLLDVLRTGHSTMPRDAIVLERERHANVRRGDLSYPSRALRTRDFLYIRNFRPDRWPAGDPEKYQSVGPFGDIDGSPTKDLILAHRDDPNFKDPFRMACAKRPAEELYDLTSDPIELKNVAQHEHYAEQMARLRAMLDRSLKETQDPRATADDDRFDQYPYVGPEAKGASR